MNRRIHQLLRATLFFFVLAASPATGFAQQGGPQTATATADEAEVEFRLGNEAYLAGDYQSALSHYFASFRLVPNRNVLFNIAKCYENLDRFVEAHRYYSEYLSGLTEEDEREDVRKALDRIGAEIGILSVESKPSGATIYLNRKDLGSYGTTPTEVPVQPDTYDVIIERDGWNPVVMEGVEVKGGSRVEKSVTMKRREGTVALTGQPKDVTVTPLPDGDPVDVELPAELALPLGEQSLRVDAAGWESALYTVEVRENATVSLGVDLQRETGTLVVQSTEAASAIYVDGELLGFTPAVISTTVGEREVVVRAQGFAPFRVKVKIETDERLEVDAVLTGANEVAAASRVAESVRDAPASVSLIGSREIEAFGYTGTRDALRGTRGIYFSDDLTFIQPGIRGYGPFGQFGNRMLVLVDGHTVNDSWLEASFHEFELLTDLYGIDRIEFVRGPTSVLYGSGAFQGVVSLASPDIDDEFTPTRIGAGGVGDGAVRGYAHVREAFEGGGVQATAGTVRGQPREFVSPTRERLGEEARAVDVGDFWTHTARLNAKWHSLSLYSFFNTRDKQSPTGEYETVFGDSRTREQDTRAFVDVRFADDLADAARLESRVYGDYYAFDGAFAYPDDEGGVFTDTFDGVWIGAEGRLILRPFEGARWTVGIEGVRHVLHSAFSFDEEETTLDSDNPFWKTSASAILRQDFSSRFAVWAGARYDLWVFDSLQTPEGTEEPKTIDNANPRLVVLSRPIESGTLKLMAARGFRAPSVYELIYNDGGITQISAPGLTPETIWSGEVEYTQTFGERVEGVVAVYAQQIANRIETTGEATSDDPLQFQNVDGRLWNGGLEFELRRSFFRGWMATAQYSLQRAREGRFEQLFAEGDNIPNSPLHLASIKVVAPIIARSLRLANRVVYESPRIDRAGGETLPVVLWDFMFTGEMTGVPLRWGAGVRNALDWRYSSPAGDEVLDVTLRQPGRTLVVDVAAVF